MKSIRKQSMISLAFVFLVSIAGIAGYYLGLEPTLQRETGLAISGETQAVKKAIEGYYRGYADQNPDEVVAQTTGPLSQWERTQAESFVLPDRNVAKSEGQKATILLRDMDIEILKIETSEVLAKVRLIMEIISPENIKGTSELENKFKLRKIGGHWKIYDRTYNNAWVSRVF